MKDKYLDITHNTQIGIEALKKSQDQCQFCGTVEDLYYSPEAFGFVCGACFESGAIKV